MPHRPALVRSIRPLMRKASASPWAIPRSAAYVLDHTASTNGLWPASLALDGCRDADDAQRNGLTDLPGTQVFYSTSSDRTKYSSLSSARSAPWRRLTRHWRRRDDRAVARRQRSTRDVDLPVEIEPPPRMETGRNGARTVGLRIGDDERALFDDDDELTRRFRVTAGHESRTHFPTPTTRVGPHHIRLVARFLHDGILVGLVGVIRDGTTWGGYIATSVVILLLDLAWITSQRNWTLRLGERDRLRDHLIEVRPQRDGGHSCSPHPYEDEVARRRCGPEVRRPVAGTLPAAVRSQR